MSILKVGDVVELCSCSQKLLNKNNYPLVRFHCIIKIMCQDLSLGCLHCLLVCVVQNINFGCSERFFIFLLEHQMVLKLFALSFYINFLFFLIFSELFEYQRYGECSDYNRLSCLSQILFLMHCFSRFDETINFYRWYKP